MAMQTLELKSGGRRTRLRLSVGGEWRAPLWFKCGNDGSLYMAPVRHAPDSRPFLGQPEDLGDGQLRVQYGDGDPIGLRTDEVKVSFHPDGNIGLASGKWRLSEISPVRDRVELAVLLPCHPDLWLSVDRPRSTDVVLDHVVEGAAVVRIFVWPGSVAGLFLTVAPQSRALVNYQHKKTGERLITVDTAVEPVPDGVWGEQATLVLRGAPVSRPRRVLG